MACKKEEGRRIARIVALSVTNPSKPHHLESDLRAILSWESYVGSSNEGREGKEG